MMNFHNEYLAYTSVQCIIVISTASLHTLNGLICNLRSSPATEHKSSILTDHLRHSEELTRNQRALPSRQPQYLPITDHLRFSEELTRNQRMIFSITC